MPRYITIDGEEVTKEQIQQAFAAGKAVLCHYRVDSGNPAALAIDGRQYDTRGECYSMWEEGWTVRPDSIQQCYAAARY